MVGFDQSAYAFDEDTSTGQVCITFTGDLSSTASPNLGLILVEETAEGLLLSVVFWKISKFVAEGNIAKFVYITGIVSSEMKLWTSSTVLCLSLTQMELILQPPMTVLLLLIVKPLCTVWTLSSLTMALWREMRVLTSSSTLPVKENWSGSSSVIPPSPSGTMIVSNFSFRWRQLAQGFCNELWTSFNQFESSWILFLEQWSGGWIAIFLVTIASPYITLSTAKDKSMSSILCG